MSYTRFMVGTSSSISVVMVALTFAAGIVVGVDLTAEAVELGLFAGVLLFISFVDIESRRIPNECIVAALAIRILYWMYSSFTGLADMASIGYYVASALGTGAALLALTLAADALFHQESMGGGDLKLYAVAALYFGWQNALVVVFLSCLFALVGWVVCRASFSGSDSEDSPTEENAHPSNTMPFGPAIALACLAPMLLGNPAKWFFFL